MSQGTTIAANTASFAIAREDSEALTEDTPQVASFEDSVRQHAKFVFRVAYGVLRNIHDAEDVVQEVFLRVHRSETSTVRDMRAWLATIAFRLAIDRKRKPEALDIADFEIQAKGANAERQAIRHQQVDHVQKLIASLPEELRFPLVLSAMEELNSRQIAEVLGIPESSVRGRIMRARQVLREKLAAMSESTL